MSKPDPTLTQDILTAIEQHGGWRKLLAKLEESERLRAALREIRDATFRNTLQLRAVAERALDAAK